MFIDALWSPAKKGLTTWPSFVMSDREVVTFPLVSCVRWDAWLYRFLIFALFLILRSESVITVFRRHPLYCIYTVLSNVCSLMPPTSCLRTTRVIWKVLSMASKLHNALMKCYQIIHFWKLEFNS